MKHVHHTLRNRAGNGNRSLSTRIAHAYVQNRSSESCDSLDIDNQPSQHYVLLRERYQ
ncbi:hypothetical protein PAXRUDRAFT_823270 [Paxillus rubicundulus Ve08.2h10]|uniref:Uncharacterized protein n=1 Tax=Paxillus rubicundulus Ve08.2h10 TaxID=930991 RepID=A0A0D0E402_9AGAM|nr:hypothetical protein PAXRUDRAFT_823270 [Paxillus rubicundulus Ve08.2h10]